MGGLQAKSMTSQRNRVVKDGGCVTMATLRQQQDGGYVLPWQRYDNNKMVAMRYHVNDDVILHLQQYSHRLNLLYFFLFLASCFRHLKQKLCVSFFHFLRCSRL